MAMIHAFGCREALTLNGLYPRMRISTVWGTVENIKKSERANSLAGECTFGLGAQEMELSHTFLP